MKNNLKLIADRVKTFIPAKVQSVEPVVEQVTQAVSDVQKVDCANPIQEGRAEISDNDKAAAHSTSEKLEASQNSGPVTSEALDNQTTDQILSSSRDNLNEDVEEDSEVSRMIREISEGLDQIEKPPVEIEFPEFFSRGTKEILDGSAKRSNESAEENIGKKLKYESPLEFLRLPKNKYGSRCVKYLNFTCPHPVAARAFTYRTSRAFTALSSIHHSCLLSVCTNFRAPPVDQILCPYQLSGTCNDAKCQMMHI